MQPAVAAVVAAILLDRGRSADALDTARAALAAPHPWTIAPRVERLRAVEARALAALAG